MRCAAALQLCAHRSGIAPVCYVTSSTDQPSPFLVTGRRYEGEWLSGSRHGQGECAYANGDHYAGCWQDGLFNGEGCLQLPRWAL
jgi:hypothetical protein